MKKNLYILISILCLTSARGQDRSADHLLSSVGSRNLTYIEIDKSAGIVFKLGSWIDKAGGGYSIIVVDTIEKQTDIAGYLFEGQNTRVWEEHGNWYLKFRGDKGIPGKKIELTITEIGKDLNVKMNNAYWWTSFFQLSRNLHSRFTWGHYGFRNGFKYWDQFDAKEIPYKDFRKFADEKIRAIKDSVTMVETARTRLAKNIISSISKIQYSALKDSVAKLPVRYDGSAYSRIVVREICDKRPEVFFKLADDLPDFKRQLFSVFDKQTIRTLKAVDTTSPSKEEFLKEKRHATFSLIAGTTLYVAVFSLVILAL
jgi:hypothetical protein